MTVAKNSKEIMENIKIQETVVELLKIGQIEVVHIHLIIEVEDHMIDLHQGIDINILNRSEVGQRTEFKDRLDLLKGGQTKNMHGHLGQEVDQWIEWIGLEIDLGQTMVEEDDRIQEINIEGQETVVGHQQVDQGQGTGKGQDLLKVVEDLLLIHHM